MDLIFKDRNKNYGAYEILKSSVRRIRISFIAAVVLFVLLILVIGGIIRIPWIKQTDNTLVYNTVSVKYDPSLITALSKPFQVDAKKENKKVFTEPKIVDEDQEVVAAVKQKQVTDEPKADTTINNNRGDSIKQAENEPKETVAEIVKRRTDTVIFIEHPPQFPGGADALRFFISSHLKYPIDALNRKVQGTVVLSFIVEKNGSIKRILITKNIDPVLDFEAVRVIAAMPPWQPASNKGKPIAAMIVLPVNFSIRP